MNHKSLLLSALALTLIAPSHSAVSGFGRGQFFGENGFVRETLNRRIDSNPDAFLNISGRQLIQHAFVWSLATKAIKDATTPADLLKLGASSAAGSTAATFLYRGGNYLVNEFANPDNRSQAFKWALGHALMLASFSAYLAGQNPEAVARMVSHLKTQGIRQSFEDVCDATKNFITKDASNKDRIAAVARTFAPLFTAFADTQLSMASSWRDLLPIPTI